MYGKKLNFLRTNKNIKENQLALILKIKVNTYSQYETEYKAIPIKHLNILCNYFNVSFDYIFDLTDTLNYKYSRKSIDGQLAGQRLKDFRKENDLTQTELANFLNTSQSNIVKYENGKSIISTQFLYAISSKYNISCDYLLGKTNTSKNL